MKIEIKFTNNEDIIFSSGNLFFVVHREYGIWRSCLPGKGVSPYK
jgi:hypothetical protein